MLHSCWSLSTKMLEAFRFQCCHNYATDLKHNKLESPSISDHQRAADELLEPLINTRAVIPADGPSIFKWGFTFQLGFTAQPATAARSRCCEVRFGPS